MTRRLAAAGGLAASLALAYLASPFLALHRLEVALRAGDVDAVEDAVDWDQVRARLKHDVAGPSAREVMDRGGLPAFGASFMESIASRVVDETVTPEALCQAVQESRASGGGAARLERAGFDGPLAFVAELRLPSAGDAPSRLRLRMAIEGGRWKVIEVRAPDETPPSRT